MEVFLLLMHLGYARDIDEERTHAALTPSVLSLRFDAEWNNWQEVIQNKLNIRAVWELIHEEKLRRRDLVELETNAIAERDGQLTPREYERWVDSEDFYNNWLRGNPCPRRNFFDAPDA